jgi:CheY-like chemotaxis protein
VIMYVEDDDNDAFLLRHAFKEAGMPQELTVVTDGDSAIEYLKGAAASPDREKHPRLLLLDLSMPGKSGFEVLQWVRSQPGLSHLPAIIFTSSHQETDVEEAYARGANGFLVKPSTPDALLAMVLAVRDFWLRHNVGPRLAGRSDFGVLQRFG